MRYCSCGKKQSESVLSLGHNYENGKCTVCDDTLKPSEGLEFTSNNDGTCYVSGIGTCTDTDIVIPTEYNGMRVTEVGSAAFENYSSLTSIKIPNSVTTIGDDAFLYCSRLTSINYNGTKAQWNAISKGSEWNWETGNYTIYCTDGNISK